MFDLEHINAVQADKQRMVAWVERHAWKHERVRRGRSREAVARALRAFAARLAPVDGEAVGERGRYVADQRA
jgi:hypothetical protein